MNMKIKADKTTRSAARRRIDSSSRGQVATQLQEAIDLSPRQLAQAERVSGLIDPVQRQGPEEEELLQGRFDLAQRQGLEDEELLQGRFDTAQRLEDDEELLQGRFDPAQRQGPEEEEPLQGKAARGASQAQSGAGASLAENSGGLPSRLLAGVENLSGMDLSDVRVHPNSVKPAQLNALAYAQGNDIHLGSGQDKHLPHEAWHVVQQRQGRVRPTMDMSGVQVNDDPGLEHEADVMGEKAMNQSDAVSSKES